MSPAAEHRRRFDDERGFSLVQMIVVLGIVAVVAGFSIFGIRSARTGMRLGTSARGFAQVAEKARMDAIRRRTTTHIEFLDSNTYEVTMDFTGDGIGETRNFKLDDGIVLTDANGVTMTSSSTDLPYADFDWRGRTYNCNALFRMKNTRSDQLVVQIAGSGDITVNSTVGGLPTVDYANVNASADVNPSATLTGNDNKLNLSPCGTVSATPTPTPTPAATPEATPESTPEDPPCQLTVSPTKVDDLPKNGGGQATVTATVNGPGTIVASPDKDGNLTVTTTASQIITASTGGSVAYTVKSKTNAKNITVPIKFEFSNCSPVSVDVSVVNK